MRPSSIFCFISSCILFTGGLFAQSPLDDLIVTIPNVKNDDKEVLQPKEQDSSAFKAPAISLTPEVSIEPAEILAPEEDRTLQELLEKGAANLASNQVYEATRYFWRASRRASSNQDALSGMAASFLLAEDGGRALQIYKVLAEKYPTEEEYLFNLASCHYKLNQFDQADEILSELAQLHPSDAKILYNLGLNKVAGGKRETGIRLLEKSFELLPQNPFPMLALARLYAREGEKQPMLACLEKAASLLDPDELKLYLGEPAFDAWRNDGLFERILSGSF